MDLIVQIQSLLYSFVYGYFFSFLLNWNYHFLNAKHIIVRVLTNLFFVIDNVLLYFILLRIINSSVFHIYFLFMIVLGFLYGNKYTKKIRHKKINKVSSNDNK